MLQEIEAIYEKGVLRPLTPVTMAESEMVRVLISSHTVGHSQRDLKQLARARAEVADQDDIPSIEEVRRMLSVIPGSISEDVIKDRGR
ncbi:MAG: antitoxin family protein [Candidatus Solibacter usitatus]|nr:antitoxin family protein [Candidatus Solibacter usitatus]